MDGDGVIFNMFTEVMYRGIVAYGPCTVYVRVCEGLVAYFLAFIVCKFAGNVIVMPPLRTEDCQ